MAILSGVGASQKHDPKEAIEEAYNQASQSLQGHLPTFMLLFSSSTTYDQQTLVDTLKAKAPEAILTGCSSAGEITSISGSVDKSVALMLIYSNTMKFSLQVGENVHEDSRAAGKQLAKRILENNNNQKPTALLMIPDGIMADGQQVVQGILDEMGQDFLLAGGSAADDFLFTKVYQYNNGQIINNSVLGIGLYGDFNFGIGVRHGLTPISVAHKVTKAQGNMIYEIDHQPAFKIYEQYFAKEISELKAQGELISKITAIYPFGINAPNKEGYLIRGVLNTDDQGTVTLTSGVPEGEDIYLMIGSQEEGLSAAEDAARQVLLRTGGKTIKAVILFNCIARKTWLLEKKQEEIDRIREILGKDIPLIGFYTYGEQAPLGEKIMTCSFHNATDVLFVLAE